MCRSISILRAQLCVQVGWRLCAGAQLYVQVGANARWAQLCVQVGAYARWGTIVCAGGRVCAGEV